jgi:hypothetical protein
MAPDRLEAPRQWARKLLGGLLIAGALALPAMAQNFRQTFRVTPGAGELEVSNKRGEIKIKAETGATKIKISAWLTDGSAQVVATQTPEGRVKVEVAGPGRVDFEITVPPSSSLDLLCFKGSIIVFKHGGVVHARIADGNIELTGIRSPRVEAHSTSGNVSFAGEVLPSGSYTLKSFSGRVDATLPTSSDFKLYASSGRGGMELGEFPIKFGKQTDQSVEGTHGVGRASIRLWTQEGSIHLHRKP